MARLEHIGIAVHDAAPVAEMLRELLGFELYRTETVEREGVQTHFIDGGSVKLELLESLGEGSPIARFLEKRGEGIHHLSFEVDDVASVMRRGRELGLTPLSEEPLTGADGKLVAFFHPRDTHGMLIEVCQTVREDAD